LRRWGTTTAEAADEDLPSINVDVNVVNVLASVRDKHGT